jgi:hypothetical protein
MTIDLNRWHHAIHQVSGSMALKFNKAMPTDLVKWAGMLKEIAVEMEALATPAIDRQNQTGNQCG